MTLLTTLQLDLAAVGGGPKVVAFALSESTTNTMAFGRTNRVVGWNSAADIYPPVVSNPNLFVNPSTIGASPWSDSTFTSTFTYNALANPLDGAVTATKWFGSSGGADMEQEYITLTDNLNYTMSAYFKAAETTLVTLRCTNLSAYADFNLTTGTVATSYLVSSSSIVSAGGGWYRCIITVNSGTTGGIPYGFRFQQPAVTGGVYIYGPKLEQSSTVTSYGTAPNLNNGSYSTYVPNIIRQRSAGLALIETETLSGTIGILKQVALALAETYSYSFSVAKVKLLTATIAETEVHSFGTFRRTLGLLAALNEVTTHAASLQRTRTVAATLAEVQVLSDTLNRVRTLQEALVEVESITVAAGRLKQIAAAIAEAETLAATLVKLKMVAFASLETQTDTVAVGRGRALIGSLTEQETLVSIFGRVRGLVDQVASSSNFVASFGRLRKTLIDIGEQNGFGFTVYVDTSNRVNNILNGTMSWQQWVALPQGGQQLQTFTESFSVVIEGKLTIPVSFEDTIVISI